MRHICFFGVQIYNILQIVYKGSWNISLKNIKTTEMELDFIRHYFF